MAKGGLAAPPPPTSSSPAILRREQERITKANTDMLAFVWNGVFNYRTWVLVASQATTAGLMMTMASEHALGQGL